MRDKVGEARLLFAFSNDVYFMRQSHKVAKAITSASGLYDMVGLRMEFITRALEENGKRNDRLFGLVAGIVEEDPFAVLRLFEVSGVRRLGQIMAADSPEIIAPFVEPRNAYARSCFEVI
jgi:hypothetical protein